MKTTKILSILLIAFFMVSFFTRPVFALDTSDEYPSLLWGPTTVIESPGTPQELTFYSQTEGNEIMRNVAAANSTSPSFDFANNLFVLGGNFPGSLKLLNSHTYINGTPKITTAVLRQVGVNVFGDSNNASGNYNYWGQHLRQTTDSSDSNALWQQKAYSFNPKAQAVWDNSQLKNQTLTDTVARLLQNAKPLSNSPTNLITTAFDGVCGSPTASGCGTETAQYPDGRVWYSDGPLTIKGGVTYSKKSTIIIKNGNLTINGSLTPKDSANDGIGFIVENGNVTIQNANGKSVQAAIFAPKGTITNNFIVASNNVSLTGSFVASGFDTGSYSNISFIQDTRSESTWPPGFRDLQPLSSQSR